MLEVFSGTAVTSTGAPSGTITIRKTLHYTRNSTQCTELQDMQYGPIHTPQNEAKTRANTYRLLTECVVKMARYW